MAWRKPSNLRDWIKILARHRKKAFFPGLAVMIVVVIVALMPDPADSNRFLIEREYQAEAKFQRRMDLTVTQAGSSTITQNLDPVRRAMNEDLMGRAAIDQLINDLIASDNHVSRLWQFPHAPDGALTREGEFEKQDLIRQIQSRLSVRFQVRSDPIDQMVVSYSDPDREMAPKLCNRLIENYIKNTRDQLNGMLLKSQRFYRGEVDRFSNIVREMEGKKLRFELDHPGLVADDPANIRVKLADNKSKRDRIEEDLLVQRHKLDALVKFYKQQPDLIEKQQTIQNPELKKLVERRDNYADQLEESVNVLKRTEQHPDVINLRRRIGELNEEIARTAKEVQGDVEKEPNIQKLEAEQKVRELAAEITAKQSQVEELNNKVEELELQDRNFFAARKDYVEIAGTLKDAQGQAKFWEDNLRKTTIALTQEVGYRGVHLDFIQQAPELDRPSKPKLYMIGGIAVGAGLAFAGLIIVLAELLDRSFRTVEQAVDDLKLPVLGAVNEIVTPGRAWRKKMLGWGLFPAITVVMLIILGASIFSVYISLDQPYKFEQFKNNPISYVQKTYLGG